MESNFNKIEVRCPNNCDDGNIKHYSDPTKALYHIIKCPYCKGNGKVSEQQAMIINKLL